MLYHSNNNNTENIHKLFTQVNPYLRVLGNQRKQKIKGPSLNVTVHVQWRHRLHGFLCTFKQQIRTSALPFLRLCATRGLRALHLSAWARLDALLVVTHALKVCCHTETWGQPHRKQLGVTFFLPEAGWQSKGKISPKQIVFYCKI